VRTTALVLAFGLVPGVDRATSQTLYSQGTSINTFPPTAGREAAAAKHFTFTCILCNRAWRQLGTVSWWTSVQRSGHANKESRVHLRDGRRCRTDERMVGGERARGIGGCARGSAIGSHDNQRCQFQRPSRLAIHLPE